MEFQEGGTLGELLEKQQKMPEDDARVIAAQILLVLDYMNRLKIVHRDLKPENILLNSRKDKDFDIRVADFGYATKVKKCNRDKS